ncbi:MAG: PhzF family phenazine biosynthesis protein [Pyrinomonadaceae bacterium]
MRQYNFLQLDVFTDRAFSGNPLAVFPEAEGISDEEMQQIALEMNLSETVFVLPPRDEKTLRRLRIFTPARELPFAGHPVVGTWNALARLGVVPAPEDGNGWVRIYHEVGIGVLPVDIAFKDGQPLRVVMTQGKFEAREAITDAQQREEIVRGLGLSVEDLDESLPVQAISTGINVLGVPLRSLEALKRCRVNASVLIEAHKRAGGDSCYAFTRETIEGGRSQAHARLFAPDFNIAEDPATGSAGGSLAAYLVHHGALDVKEEDGAYRFVIEQGDFMHRPSRIHAEVTGERGHIEQVRVGGTSVVVARGELMF